MAKSPTTRGAIFWVVAIAALLWNVMGCINLAQQMTPAGIATLPPDYQTFIAERPSWALGGFAVSVIAGIIGAIALILRKRLAFGAFIASAIGALVATVPALSSGLMSIIVGSALSIVLALAWAVYARRRVG